MVNVRRVAELSDEGRMRPAGLAEVNAAKEDGRWAAAYEGQKDAVVPEELVAALAEDPAAGAAFAELGRTDRYQLMLGLLQARTPRRRSTQVAAILAKLAKRR
jgi:uncharacterized protein YdeI (YjbR/CyaY-like superfamily)